MIGSDFENIIYKITNLTKKQNLFQALWKQTASVVSQKVAQHYSVLRKQIFETGRELR